MDLIAAARALEDPSGRAGVSASLARLAERILTMAGGAADLQTAAREVGAARDRLMAGEVALARAAVQRAASPLVARAQRGRIETRGLAADPSRLAGAAALLPAEGRRQ
jgi:hypothetical protein